MRVKNTAISLAVIVGLFAIAERGKGQGGDDAVEVMTRGPVHEAFAHPVNVGKVSPLVVPKKPPEPIEETPPDVRPEDEGAIWIGGYWAWSEDQDFLWVSGVWRVPPEGRIWVSGYWTEVPGGFSWVPGFWNAADQQQVEYYPEPPESLEQGPTSDPPSPDYVWSSGNWEWRDGRYAWRPGYWIEARASYVWTAPSYYWSPRGWLFRLGYWDYELADRGALFAPVHFTSPIYRQPRYVYTPSIVVNVTALKFYLFVRPSYCHYYFGDYFASNYERIGIYPWFSVGQHHGYRYDSLYAHHDWRYRGRDPRWSEKLKGWHRYYREHPDRRPPHNFAAAQRRWADAKQSDRPDRDFVRIADSVKNWRERPEGEMRFRELSPEQKRRYEQTAKSLRQLERDRVQWEKADGRQDQRRDALRAPQTVRLPAAVDDIAKSLPARERRPQAPGLREGGARQTRETMRPVERQDERRRAEQRPAGRRPDEQPDQRRDAQRRQTEQRQDLDPRRGRDRDQIPEPQRPSQDQRRQDRSDQGRERATQDRPRMDQRRDRADQAEPTRRADQPRVPRGGDDARTPDRRGGGEAGRPGQPSENRPNFDRQGGPRPADRRGDAGRGGQEREVRRPSADPGARERRAASEAQRTKSPVEGRDRPGGPGGERLNRPERPQPPREVRRSPGADQTQQREVRRSAAAQDARSADARQRMTRSTSTPSRPESRNIEADRRRTPERSVDKAPSRADRNERPSGGRTRGGSDRGGARGDGDDRERRGEGRR